MGTTMGKNSGTFLEALPAQGTFHVVMLGLDSAGKTTALYRLKFDQYLNTVPTIGFNCEKVQCSVGKAKGVQFLVWDVGGQEKLRPLWRSYTRCTDGILFVVDSVDIERMEEAKIELMRTAKCPDNQGVPVLVLANKQDLPGAREPTELEKLLGLNELQYPSTNFLTKPVTSSLKESTIVKTNYSSSSCSIKNILSPSTSTLYSGSSDSKDVNNVNCNQLQKEKYQISEHMLDSTPAPASSALTTTVSVGQKTNEVCTVSPPTYKGWHVQPACAITGEGLQEGLEILYDMILKRRKINKVNKKKR